MLNTIVEDWGLIDYRQAQEQQLQKVADVQTHSSKQYILVCRHPAIATLGRKTQDVDYSEWQGDSVEVQRGGRVTYHGPHQIIIYPIVHLNPEGIHRRNLAARDLHSYLRLLEKSVIQTLAFFGIDAKNSPSPEMLALSGDVEPTGVWVENKKICSIGIGVKKWVTFHGLALNVLHDSKAFQGLRPCGFSPEVMTDMEHVLPENRQSDASQLYAVVKDRLIEELRSLLE